ncbi:BlaI/MecI/CopY family transcriptional regulator [Gloeobacter kilaueensis]|uniref:CopY family transcriptional regulator n=1 Tax=Gloeobacter kilaueensis (strain ATCC BAA-2537 / CCAP 1431/1 / ULC 316 / JS1) TaxID=1183438 RepID=U5QHB6_GLOK1|nr:BlaI/MecI/CopY family transcriptional regulator [Gloeobacter kilaueensis]AGY58293.1 CopY family transcriptional regulator [Gloeobacter kilaueensis JS1]
MHEIDRGREAQRQPLVRTAQSGLKKLLGDQEAEIMEQVWAMDGPVLARQVHEAMPGGAKLAYSTVVCTMGRLVAKGLLKVTNPSTKPYLYVATIGREAFIETSVRRVLASLAKDFPAAVAGFLQGSENLSPELGELLSHLED